MENGAVLATGMGYCFRWNFQRHQVIRQGEEQYYFDISLVESFFAMLATSKIIPQYSNHYVCD